MPAALAGLGGRQAQLAADHADRFLHRLVGRGEPGVVPVELAQGGAGRCRRGEPGAGLVGGHQQPGHRFGCRRELERQQAPVELALGGRGVPQVGPGRGEIAAVIIEAVEVGLEAPVRRAGDRQVAAGRRLSLRRADGLCRRSGGRGRGRGGRGGLAGAGAARGQQRGTGQNQPGAGAPPRSGRGGPGRCGARVAGPAGRPGRAPRLCPCREGSWNVPASDLAQSGPGPHQADPVFSPAASRGLPGPAVRGQAAPADPPPESRAPGSAGRRRRVVQDVVLPVRGGTGGQGGAAQRADDPLPVDPGHRRPGTVMVSDRAA